MKNLLPDNKKTKTIINQQMRAALLLATTVGTGCVYIDQDGAQTAELYRWTDRQVPLATRDLQVDYWQRKFFNFSNLLHDAPGLMNASDTPYIVRTCDPQICYSSIVFSSDFVVNSENFLLGTATISALSTTMYHEVSDLPQEAVSTALDALADKVLLPAERISPYADLVRLDIADEVVRDENLIHPELEGLAMSAIQTDGKHKFTSLLQSVTSDMTDLVSGSEFGFSSANRIYVDVDVSTRIEGPVHLSICNSFDKEKYGYTVDYASCQLKVTLDDGRFIGELELPSTGLSLLVTVLPMRALDSVEYVEWVSSANATLEVR